MENIKLSHNLDALMDTFQIHQIKKCVHLDRFLAVVTEPLKPSYKEIFDMLIEEIQDKGDQWNEEELKMKFIAFLFFISEMEEKGKIQAFYERPLSATLNGHKIQLKTDCMVATPLGKIHQESRIFSCRSGTPPDSKKAEAINLTPKHKCWQL